MGGSLGKHRNLLFLFALFFLVGLTACNTDEKAATVKEEKGQGQAENAHKEEEGEKQEVEERYDQEISTTIEEIVKERNGQYSGNGYNKAIINKSLDEMNFQDKDSFQVYSTLLSLMSESEEYKELYDYAEGFNAEIETVLSDSPETKDMDNGQGGQGTVNVAILLDASGSMNQKIGGKTKMELAKEAINGFMASMPEEANVALRIYGHKGSNADSDKAVSCGSTEMVYDLKPYDAADFKTALGQFQPTGWTPIAKAITEAKKDFEQADKQGQNTIYIVSDGIETCGGDPVKAAQDLHDSNIEAVVNIIGFDVDSNGQKQLLKIAQAGGGQFETVKTAEEFKRVWEKERVRLYNEWSSWTADNYNEVSREQSDKLNELYKKRSDFKNLLYDEKNHLDNAVQYLRGQEQISSEVREEVDSLSAQRRKIVEEYVDGAFTELIETVETEGKQLKDKINETGDEMKDKYNNN
ncbi:MAG: VWA domain-containing protein [Bacillus sp. (in: firmicutes)]